MISDYVLGFTLILLVLFMQWMVFVNRIFVVFSLSSVVAAAAFGSLGWRTSMTEYDVLAALAIIFRAWLIPWLVTLNLHKKPERSREEAPVVPTASGILIALALVLAALGIFQFVFLPRYGRLNEASALALALLFQGVFLIVSHRNAFIQLAGYLVVENAVLLFAAWAFPVIPLIVEGAVVLDVLGLVVVARVVMRLREKVSDKIGRVREETEREDLKG